MGAGGSGRWGEAPGPAGVRGRAPGGVRGGAPRRKFCGFKARNHILFSLHDQVHTHWPPEPNVNQEWHAVRVRCIITAQPLSPVQRHAREDTGFRPLLFSRMFSRVPCSRSCRRDGGAQQRPLARCHTVASAASGTLCPHHRDRRRTTVLRRAHVRWRPLPLPAAAVRCRAAAAARLQPTRRPCAQQSGVRSETCVPGWACSNAAWRTPSLSFSRNPGKRPLLILAFAGRVLPF